MSEHFPLFTVLPNQYADCPHCLDTGLTRNADGEVVPCERRTFCQSCMNRAAKQIETRFLGVTLLGVDAQAFDLARIISHYDAANPCKREKLESLFFAEHPDAQTGDGERKIKKLIETLRRDWLLPIGSTKFAPYGHWIMTTGDELRDWRKHAASAPITQLATIYRVVRANRAAFAGQIDFDFHAEIAAAVEAKIAEMEAAQ